ncbi:MAG: SDR family oxidoreductase [Roseateles asaccharophilus]|uniref:NAD(P)-dependent dehydrogenase (Short-subunit alcohol dehydrogenase family) n=1 Tax=Roseateles asaccharophilus TaxID=582607 RepID=A0A4R6NAS6_9BURK|nr:SDR family oxidoreductase [Roseateles asaccharophilus]MDN3546613.1 SDR family oxidoreductase [Roseateles asaccharophilus]TDP12836.1 NAD(P)-dependent dehydrogenase (short-subunit alcohol dehydrogenase family) [Roseateles asaccharophilus]
MKPVPLTLITGASRGIGAATARLLAARGHDLALNYARDAGSAQALEAELRAAHPGQRFLALQADVADEAQVLAMFTRIDAELGRLNGLVNNAGIVVPAQRLAQMDMARWQRLFAVNVFGTLLCSREAARRMSTRQGGAGGAIVNLSSRAAKLGSPGIYADYAASKGAVDSLTVSLGRELIGEGIRVNGVRPGIIETEIHADSGTMDLLPAATAGIPIQRLGRAEEVAEAIAWLLSDAASYTVATTLDVAGGR